jgi:hypothetical protein
MYNVIENHSTCPDINLVIVLSNTKHFWCLQKLNNKVEKVNKSNDTM